MLNVLRLLLYLGGMAYKKDLLLYLSIKSDGMNGQSVSSTILNRLVKKSYVELIKKEKFNTAFDVVKITDLGICYIANKENKTSDEVLQLAPSQKSSRTSKSLNKLMNRNRVLISVVSCGALVFPSEKPSLDYLYATLMGASATSETQEAYKDSFSRDELVNILNTTGIFYTDKECRKFFLNQIDNNDTTLAVKFSGAYLRQDKILIFFLESPHKNKTIFFDKSSMQSILHSLEMFGPVTDEYRNLNMFGPKDVAPSGGFAPKSRDYTSKPYAVILSNGYEKVYASVIGKKYGMLEPGIERDGYDQRETARFRKKDKSKKTTSSRYMLRADLNEDHQVFRRTFVCPFSSDGLTMLNYLMNTSVEGWYSDSKGLFACSPFTCPEQDNKIYNQLFPGVDTTNNSSAIFIPVPEINVLRSIHEQSQNTSILTYNFLVEPLSRAIRNPNVKFYVINNLATNPDGTLAPEIEAVQSGLYATSGRFAGRDVLESYLAKKELMYTDSECRKLPTLFNQSAVDFWNDVYQKKISFKQIEKVIAPHPLKKPKRHYHRKSGKYITYGPCTEEEYKAIKRYCSMKGISVRHLIKSIVVPEIKAILAEMSSTDDEPEDI